MIDPAVVDKIIEAVVSEDGGTALERDGATCECDNCQIGRALIDSKMESVLAVNIASAIITDIKEAQAEDIPSILMDNVYSALVNGFALGRAYERSQQLEAMHAKV